MIKILRYRFIIHRSNLFIHRQFSSMGYYNHSIDAAKGPNSFYKRADGEPSARNGSPSPSRGSVSRGRRSLPINSPNAGDIRRLIDTSRPVDNQEHIRRRFTSIVPAGSGPPPAVVRRGSVLSRGRSSQGRRIRPINSPNAGDIRRFFTTSGSMDTGNSSRISRPNTPVRRVRRGRDGSVRGAPQFSVRFGVAALSPSLPPVESAFHGRQDPPSDTE